MAHKESQKNAKVDEEASVGREERLARAFKALANANRLRIYQVILEHSREQDQVDLARVPAGCAFGDFIQRLNVGAPTVSHHVRELVEAGLITVTRQGRRRYCRINPDMYRLLSGFLARAG